VLVRSRCLKTSHRGQAGFNSFDAFPNARIAIALFLHSKHLKDRTYGLAKEDPPLKARIWSGTFPSPTAAQSHHAPPIPATKSNTELKHNTQHCSSPVAGQTPQDPNMDSKQSSCARIISTEIGSALTVGSRRASTGKLHKSSTMVLIREASTLVAMLNRS
jgi:hypothetical protein